MNKEFKAVNKRERIAAIVRFVFSGAVIGFLAKMVLWHLFEEIALLELTINDFNPTLLVMLLSFLLIFSGIILLIITLYRFHKLLILLSFILISMGVVNICIWVEQDFQFDILEMSYEKQKEYLLYNAGKDGYSYIGEVRGYVVEEKERDNVGFFLFVKTIAGRPHYYATVSRGRYITQNLFHVEKYGTNEGTFKGYYDDFIIKYDFDWDNNVKDDEVDNRSTSESGNIDEPQKIIVEHQRQSVPVQDGNTQTVVVEHKRELQKVQKWQNCGGCGGSGSCGTCKGSGQNPYKMDGYEECPQCHGMRKCQFCGGRGGYYYEVLE
jgi:hypothetical protein